MALKDKAKNVDFSNIGASSQVRGQGSKTAIGMHADALFRDEKVSTENVVLRQRLAEFDGASPTRLLDPKMIRQSKWANRLEKSFNNPDFERFKAEIESSGGNIQPIKVRPLAAKPDEYELIFGHRRHRACLELGLPVLAVINDMGDVDLFIQMDRENRERAPLKPYEAGLAYARALDEGLFPSARKLSESASVDLSQLGKALALARLPLDVIAAFPSPLDLQYRWASDLTQAMQKDPDRVIATAKQIAQEPSGLTSAQVLNALINGGGTVPPPLSSKKSTLTGSKGQQASIVHNETDRSVIVHLKNIPPDRFEEISKAIQKLIS